jgi:hypothetical protein
MEKIWRLTRKNKRKRDDLKSPLIDATPKESGSKEIEQEMDVLLKKSYIDKHEQAKKKYV